MSNTEALLQTILQNQQGILEAQQTQATAMEILSQSVQALEQRNDNLILRVNRTTQHPTPYRQGRAGELHRAIQSRDGRTEVRQNGRIHRQASQGNGRPLSEDELLRDNLHATERGGRDSSRGNQDLQETAQGQWPTAFRDADQWQDSPRGQDDIDQWQQRSHLRESITGLAQSWTAYQNAQLVVASGLDSALHELSEAMEAPQPHTYEEMGNLAESIVGVVEQQNLANNIIQVSAALDELDIALEQFTYRQQVKAMSAGVDEWKASRAVTDALAQVQAGGSEQAVESLESVLEQMEARPPLYSNMNKLVTSIRGWQAEQALGGVVAQVAATLQNITAHPYAQMGGLAQGISQRRTTQLLHESGLSEQLAQLQGQLEQLNRPQYQAMAGLVASIQAVQTQQGMVEAITQVAETFQQIQSPVYQYKGMAKLAQSVHRYQDVRLLQNTGLLEQIEKLTQSLTEGQHQYAGMTELSEVIASVQSEQAILNQGLQEQLAELTQQLGQMQARQFPHQYQGIPELVNAVSHRRAEEAITEHLNQVDDLVEQMEQALHSSPDMQQLIQTLMDLREISTLEEDPIAEELKALAERIQSRGINITPKPKLIQVFWVPETDPDQIVEASFPIEEKHWKELLAGSGIHPDLAELNCESVMDQEILERLLSKKIEDLGAGQLVVKDINKEFAKLKTVPEGGFWIKAGVLASTLDDPQPTEALWGSLKPDNPRMDYRKGEPQKYEHPSDVPREIFLPHVPDWLAQTVYDQYDITPQPGQHFWSVVKEHPEISINITEGGKKTLSVNSQGHVTIGLPGVNGGYRATDDNKKKLPERQIHPALAVFAVPGRHFNFLFDQDTKPRTIVNVRRDLVRAGELLVKRGCEVSSSYWDNKYKGIDDLIVGAGPRQLELAILKARPFDEIAQKHYKYSYRKLVEFVQRRDGELDPERMDLEVFMEATRRGELEDGYRFIEAGSDRVYDREYLMQSALELQKNKTRIGMAMVPIVQEMTQKHGTQHGRVKVHFTKSWVMSHGSLTTMIREKASNRVVLRYRAGHLLHVTANPQTLDKFQKAIKLTEMKHEHHKRAQGQKQKTKQQKKPRRGRRR